MADEDLGIKYSVGTGGVKATWTRRIENWSDVDTKVEMLWGTTLDVGNETFQIGVSTLPGKPWMVLTGAEIDMWEERRPCTVDSNGLPTCDQGARLTLTFDTLAYNIVNIGDGEAFLSHNIDSNMNMMTHAGHALKWQSDDKHPARDTLPAFPVVMVNHTFQWHNIYDPPLSTLYSYLGKINSLAFKGHAIGTVLFSKMGATFTLTKNLVQRYTLTLGCTARVIHGAAYDGGAITWNHFLRSDAGDDNPWQLLVHDSSGAPDEKILQSADLNQLLTLFDYVHPVSATAAP